MNLIQKARKYYLKNDYGNAISTLKKFNQQNQKNLTGQYLLGGVYLKTLKLDEAEKCFLRCLKYKPNESKFILQLATIYSMKQKFQEAIKLYQSYLETDQNNYKVHFALGVLYQDIKQFGRAIQNYKKCLQINNNFEKCKKAFLKIEQKMQKMNSQSQQQNLQTLQGYLIDLYIKLKTSQEQKKCKKCLSNSVEYANVACGHLSICEKCQKQAIGQQNQNKKIACPVCQKQGPFIKIFMV